MRGCDNFGFVFFLCAVCVVFFGISYSLVECNLFLFLIFAVAGSVCYSLCFVFFVNKLLLTFDLLSKSSEKRMSVC